MIFQSIRVIGNPASSGCAPCNIEDPDQSSLNLTSLIAGEAYTFYMQSISQADKFSAIRFFTQALRVDRVIHVTKTVDVDSVKFEIEFESGVGRMLNSELLAHFGTDPDAGTDHEFT